MKHHASFDQHKGRFHPLPASASCAHTYLQAAGSGTGCVVSRDASYDNLRRPSSHQQQRQHLTTSNDIISDAHLEPAEYDAMIASSSSCSNSQLVSHHDHESRRESRRAGSESRGCCRLADPHYHVPVKRSIHIEPEVYYVLVCFFIVGCIFITTLGFMVWLLRL